MNFLFKFSLFLILAFCSTSTKSKAQSGPEVCSIKYQYDISGNRIKREYKCEPSWTIFDPPPINTSIFSNLFPNPTTGVITGTFTSPIGGEAGGAYVSVSTMGGIIVFEHLYSEIASSITFDISQQIPGNYLVTVHAFNTMETYTITKL